MRSGYLYFGFVSSGAYSIVLFFYGCVLWDSKSYVMQDIFIIFFGRDSNNKSEIELN